MKKITTITLLVISIVLVSLYVISSTYSVIINVLDKDGQSEIVNTITIRDLLTDDNGMYNSTYYEARDELMITDDDADIIMDSVSLNETLDVLLNSVVDYKLHNKNKLRNDEIYHLIETGIDNDNNISKDLKNKLLTKTNEYITDISKYLYDIKTINNGDKV